MGNSVRVAISAIIISSAGCGGSSHVAADAADQPDAAARLDAAPGDAAAPDAAAPDGPPPVPMVTIDTHSAPVLVAYRLQPDGVWRTPTASGVSTFSFAAEQPYTVIVVCDDDHGFVTVDQASRAPSDGSEIFAFCDSSRPSNVDVTGHMAQAGQVSLGSALRDLSTKPDWDFTLQPSRGVFDLVASSATHIAIRRDIAIDGPTALSPAIDLASEGADLVVTPFEVMNASDREKLASSVSLRTPTTLFVSLYDGDPRLTVVAPGAALRATDRQSLSVTATDGASQRQITRDSVREDGPRTIVLPAALDAAHFAPESDAIGVTWSALPEHGALVLSADAFDFGTEQSRAWFYAATMSPAFERATGVTQLVLDTSAPGFKPTWKIDVSREYSRSFSAVLERTIERASSSLTETVHRDGSLRPAERSAIERAERRHRALRAGPGR
jgi:hypothetical protein